jgi:hypothetical protein
MHATVTKEPLSLFFVDLEPPENKKGIEEWRLLGYYAVWLL